MRPDGDFYALYPYGSRVYGTNHPGSDWDYVGVKLSVGFSEIEQGVINVKLMDPEHFQELLDQHNVSALECYFLPREFVLKIPDDAWNFKLSLSQLRNSFSEKASKSFVKAKKKFVSPYDWAKDERDRGKKSLFHSLRILNFGIQIAEQGKIVDYGAANEIFEEIVSNPSSDWEDYQKRWKPVFNQMATQFRALAPKD